MESEILVQKIADKTNFSSRGIRSVLELLDQGSTIPFIARYRKERTGALDELAIKTIQDAREHILQLEARRETIVAADNGLAAVQRIPVLGVFTHGKA